MNETQQLAHDVARVRKVMAIMTLAMQGARKVVQRQLRSQGRRLCEVEHREIMTLANEYLREHPAELIAQAKAIVDRWHFGKRGGLRTR